MRECVSIILDGFSRPHRVREWGSVSPGSIVVLARIVHRGCEWRSILFLSPSFPEAQNTKVASSESIASSLSSLWPSGKSFPDSFRTSVLDWGGLPIFKRWMVASKVIAWLSLRVLLVRNKQYSNEEVNSFRRKEGKVRRKSVRFRSFVFSSPISAFPLSSAGKFHPSPRLNERPNETKPY